MTNLFSELRRRNVFRVSIAYLIVAWLVVQVADIVLDNIGAPDWVMQAILLILVLAFAFVVFFAWAYEVTPEGIKRESEVDRSRSITSVTGRKLDRAIMGLLLVALGYFIWEARFAERPEAEVPTAGLATPTAAARDKSIAVLPFDNRSSRAEDEYFTEGIHDDLLTTIAKIGSMKVISRTSVMEYRDTTKNIREIAAELGVANILEGGVQRSGSQVRINVQLIDAETDEHLWAEIYDRELSAENLFAIQSEIAQAIADALQAALSPEELAKVDKVHTRNLDAYDAYLVGRKLLGAREPATIAESLRQFERAIELDPGFALAYVGLSDALRFSTYYSGANPDDVIPPAERALATAIELDDTLGEAYATRGSMKNRNRDYEGAIADYERALELSPNFADAYTWYALALGGLGRTEEAAEMYRRGLELDPLSRAMRSNVINTYVVLGQFDEVRKQLARLDELHSDWGQTYATHMSIAAGVDNRWDEALRWQSRAVKAAPEGWDIIGSMVLLYGTLGDFDTAERWIAAGEAFNPGNPFNRLARQEWLLMRGDLEAAADIAQELYDASDIATRLSARLSLLDLRDLQAGRREAPLQRYAALYPELVRADGPEVNRANFYIAVELAFLYHELGMEDRAGQVLDLAEPVIASMPLLGLPNSWWGNARTYAIRGRSADALAEARRGVEAGWRAQWQIFFDVDPILEPLRDEPEFQALRATVAADMAAQLERVRILEATGEIVGPEDLPVTREP